jgi:SAM-dependent methyltransferase
MVYSNRELEARELIRNWLISEGQWNLEANLEQLTDLEGGFVDRFNFFMPYIPESSRESVLISGCSAGSEHFVARRFGFQKVYGTEVDKSLVDIATFRLEEESDFFVSHYDGVKLPFSDLSFSFVYSGHVIEHTYNPALYFAEHLRVIKSGGYFFLEFPNRYFYRELHTNTHSFEWLPLYLRNMVLRLFGSPLLNKNAEKRHMYNLVRTTLLPVSMWQIRHYLKNSKRGGRVIAIQYPAPGYVRCLLKIN